MPGRQGESARYNITLSEADAERLEAYAASAATRPTTAARALLLAGLAAAGGETEVELTDLQRRNRELERQLEAVIERRPPPRPAAQPDSGRWEWPVADLLADSEWWDRWLPRLYELLGRRLAREQQYGGRPGFGGGHPEPVVDERGYSDLLTYLFPTVKNTSWRSTSYPDAAADAEIGHEGIPGSVRPHVWEPVLRHVVLALCALEKTAEPDADPQLRMEAAARITGSWLNVLRGLVGEQPLTPLPGPIR